MLATLARLVTGHPEGVLRHLALYGALVEAETGYAAHRLARRVAFGIAALVLLGCGVSLAGVATLLAAAGLVAADTPAWFWGIPGPVLAAALVAGWLAVRAEPVPPYASLRRQLAADAGWLVQAAEPSDERAASNPARPPEPPRASPHGNAAGGPATGAGTSSATPA